MAKDETKADKESRDKAMDAELKKFKNSVFGRKPTQPNLLRGKR